MNTCIIYLYKSFYFALFSWLESQRGLDRLKGMDIWLFLKLFGKLSSASEKDCTSPSPRATHKQYMTPFILLNLEFILRLSPSSELKVQCNIKSHRQRQKCNKLLRSLLGLPGALNYVEKGVLWHIRGLSPAGLGLMFFQGILNWFMRRTELILFASSARGCKFKCKFEP